MIRRDLCFNECSSLSNIPNETITYVISNRDIRMTYAMVGDAVYEILFYLWIHMVNEDVDTNIVNEGKSNRSMSCIMERSTIYYLSGNKKKGDGDLMEAFIGVVFIHLSDCDNKDITSTMFYWMNKVFSIDKIFSDIVYKGIDPCGVSHDRRKSTNIHSSLCSSIMKLATVYSGFNIYCDEKRCRSYIDRHNYLWSKKMKSCSSSICSMISPIIEEDDPLGRVCDLSMNIESMCNPRVGYSSRYLEDNEYIDNFEVGDDEDIESLLEGEDPEYTY